MIQNTQKWRPVPGDAKEELTMSPTTTIAAY